MARKYVEKGLDFSRKISCTACDASALALIANLNRLEGRNDEALLLFIEILDKYAETYPHIKSYVYYCMVLMFEKMNAFREAIS